MKPERYSKSELIRLTDEERDLRLREMETILNQKLTGCIELKQFQDILYSLIEELSRLGFSLGPWDYDCEIELWGGPSYMDKNAEDDLLLRSEFPLGLALAWKDFDKLPRKV